MPEQINYNGRASNDRTWAQLLPKLKAHQLEPFTDYNSKTQIGRYRIEHWEHDTASQVRIYALLGAEELLVYREDMWVPGYEGHNRDTVQGYQHEGPWIGELEAERRDMNLSLDSHVARLVRSKLRSKMEQDQADAAKIQRFAESFED